MEALLTGLFPVEEKAILNKGELLEVNFWDVSIDYNSHLKVFNFVDVHNIFPIQNKLE